MRPKPAKAERSNAAELLAALLAAYPADLLRKLEARAGLKRGGSKARSPVPLAKALLDADRVARELAACPADDLDFLASVARSGGGRGVAAADGWLRRRGIDDPSLVLRALAERGVLFYADPAHSAPAKPLPDAEDSESDSAVAAPFSTHLWVPDPVQQRLAELLPPERLPDQQPPFAVETSGLADVVRDLFVLARFVAARSPRVLTTTRHMARDDFVALAGELGRSVRAEKARRLEQVPELLWLEAVAVEAGLMATEGRRFITTPHIELFFGMSGTEQCRELLAAVVTQTRWGELETAPELVVDRSSAAPSGYSDIPSPGARVRARRTVLDMLRSEATPGRWHSIDALAERVIDLHPEFLVRRRPPHGRTERRGTAPEPIYRGLGTGDARDAKPIGMVSGWPAVEGAFIARFAEVSLRGSGVLEVGSGQEGGCFRVTELGARVLSMTEDAPLAAPDERPPGRFFLQPNFEIIADGGGDNVRAIWRLSRVAELVSFDRAALLKVTRESVCNALDAGMTRDEIAAALQDDGRVELPQNVAFSVEEWIDAYERYEVRTGTWLIETDRPDELSDLERALPDCLERIGPTAARIKPEARRLVAGALAGRDDAVEVDHSAGIGAAFSLDDRMGVTPDPSKWHWHLDHMLRRIAEPTARKGRGPWYRLTRQSVCRGLEGGLTAEEIRSFVESGAHRPLSPTQVLSLHGWLGLYEAVEVASVTLLRVPQNAVADFLTVPEVRDAIIGGIGSGVFLADAKAADKLAHFLEKAGITVKREVRAVPLKQDAPAEPSVASAAADPQRWGRRRWQMGDAEPEKASVLRAAIDRRQRVLVDYRSVVRGEPNKELVLSPQSLEESRWGQRRLHAYCHWRETYRTFDVSRMDAIVTLDKPASFPPARGRGVAE